MKEKDYGLNRILDTRKYYWVLLVLIIIGVIIALYTQNTRISVYFGIILILMVIFKKSLYLYGDIKYIKCKIMNPNLKKR